MLEETQFRSNVRIGPMCLGPLSAARKPSMRTNLFRNKTASWEKRVLMTGCKLSNKTADRVLDDHVEEARDDQRGRVIPRAKEVS